MIHGRDDNGILKCGFLWKRSTGKLRKWKPYYFILSRPCLLCFKSEDQMKDGKPPKLKVELYDISLIDFTYKRRGKSKRFYLFYETIREHGILHLKGHDVSDATSWVDKLVDAVTLCRLRKDVQIELKTASFKRQVEQNIRQRVLESNPYLRSKKVPKVTYLRRVASCEFKSHTLKGRISEEPSLAAQRSVSMDDNISRRSGVLYPPKTSSFSRDGRGKNIGRSNSSAATPSGYSQAFLDRVKSGEDNKPNVNPLALISRLSRHNTVLSTVPEDRVSKTNSGHQYRERHAMDTKKSDKDNGPLNFDFRRLLRPTGIDLTSDQKSCNVTETPNPSNGVAHVGLYRPTAAQDSSQHSRAATPSDILEHYRQVNYSDIGRHSGYKYNNMSGLQNHNSFNEEGPGGPRSRLEGKILTSNSFLAPIRSPSLGAARGNSGNRYQNSYHGYQSTPNSFNPSPFDKLQSQRASNNGYPSHRPSQLPSRPQAPSGHYGSRYQRQRISPPGSQTAFSDPRYRIDEEREWTDKNSDTWSDIDSGFIEDRLS